MMTAAPIVPAPSPSWLPIRLSQGLLSLLSTCPRKFQHLYIEQMSPYTLPDQQARMTAGSQFHALLQQWQMGLPVAPLAASDRQLEQWFAAFVAAAPEILGMDWGRDPATVRSSEQPRTLEFEGYLLTVVYDLLIQGPEQAQILDWKTYARPENPQALRQHWQTRLYLFVLVETSAYQPEQVSMVYWFFQSPESSSHGASQRLAFTYNRQQHEQTREDLRRLLRQFGQLWGRYQQGEPFPQVPLDSPECGRCSFAWRCDRAQNAPESPNESLGRLPPFQALADLATIQEIPL